MGHAIAQKNDPSLIGIALVAMSAGIVAGMLLAPKRGREMREDIMTRYNGMKIKAQDKAAKAKDKLSQTIDTARDKAKDVADKSADKVDSASEHIQRATDNT